jgi:NAD(P)-dependent dehydrogenase (short-subunit alcohol dehydrogenase family)
LLVARRREELRRTQACCVAAGAAPEDCIISPADVTDLGAAEEVVALALEAFGQLDALVNNAAVARFASLTELHLEEVDAMVRTNVLAPLGLIRHAAPALRCANGSVVNVGSIGGLLALPGRSVYGASKAALHHLTRSLARELAPEIRVNAVLPGAIDTEMYGHLGLDAQAMADLRAEMLRTTPLGRMGTPEDVVPWIEMLLGPAGCWMTGSLIVVDGGRSC